MLAVITIFDNLSFLFHFAQLNRKKFLFQYIKWRTQIILSCNMWREPPTIKFIFTKLKHTIYGFLQHTKKQWRVNQTVTSQRICVKIKMLSYTMIIAIRTIVSSELVGVNWCDIHDKWFIKPDYPNGNKYNTLAN